MTQKELKALYAEELKKVWDSERMVNHCTKSTAYVVEHNGLLYDIEKPSIETSFCFGYGFCGVSDEDSENRADDMAQHARESKEYFVAENLKDLNRWIDGLREILGDMRRDWAEGSHPMYMIATCERYYGQSEDCTLRGYSIVNTFNGKITGEICADAELVEKLIAGYEEVKKAFTKRLNTYLKRYGLSKVKSWSYLSD